jgi:Tol biopolymer transport system component
MKRDGRNPHIVARNAFAPNWSPDGHWLAFAQEGIVIARPDGTGRRVLVEGPSVSPDWSPDSQKIVFSRLAANGVHLWVVKRDGSGPQALTSGHADDFAPTWSPNGEQIAFLSKASFNAHHTFLKLIRADGANGTVLYRSRAETLGAPDWQPLRRPSR